MTDAATKTVDWGNVKQLNATSKYIQPICEKLPTYYSMGCVRETCHVTQHWACKKTPYIKKHGMCKTKKNCPNNTVQSMYETETKISTRHLRKPPT